MNSADYRVLRFPCSSTSSSDSSSVGASSEAICCRSELKRRRGRPQKLSDNELICLMVAQMLLGHPSERQFLPVAGWRLGHLFPHLPVQSSYNERCRALTPKLVTLWRAISAELPGFHDQLSFVDTTPLPCGQSVQTAQRSELAPWCGFGDSAAHSRFYWGMRLLLWCGPDGCVRDFDLVPANAPERPALLALLERQPIEGQLVIADKGFAGAEFEQAVAALGATLLRPSRANEHERPSPPIGAVRQRIESIVQSFKYQLRLEQHLARTPAGLLTRIAARVLALSAAIHLNWQLGQPPHTQRLRPLTDQASRGPSAAFRAHQLGKPEDVVVA